MYSVEAYQKECYAKRIGKVYGEMEVIDVEYDKEERHQVWTLQCVICGYIRVVNNPKNYYNGFSCKQCRKNRGEQKRLLMSKPSVFEERATHVGETYGSWEILDIEKGKGYLTRCTICGKEKWRGYAEVLNHTYGECSCNGSDRKYYTEEWSGKKIGHLTILKYQGKPNRGFVCKCDCGNTVVRKPTYLLDNAKAYCGTRCRYYQEEVTPLNGESSNRIYRILRGMKDRCNNPKNQGYYLYGGRGIKVCDEWQDYFTFKEWALTHGYRDDLSIERIDNDKGYEPSNCTWIPREDQWKNTHPAYTFKERDAEKLREKRLVEIDGERHLKKEWCDIYGITEPAVRYRMKHYGMSFEEALKMPKARGGKWTM